MRNWIIKVKTTEGVFVCDCVEDDAPTIINAAYDHFGVCAVVSRPA